MRHTPNLRIEHYRRIHPLLSESAAGENWGYFEIATLRGLLRVIASDGTQEAECGWEHVSVSLGSRTPTWEEMALVKQLFFHDDETVLQFHPKKSAYVNFMPHCLHLWRHRETAIELPPSYLVGPQNSLAQRSLA
jgi:hypothetical protein